MTFLLDCCKKRLKQELDNNNTNNNNIYINRLPTSNTSREASSLLIQKNIETLINLQKIQYEAMKELKEIHELKCQLKK